MDRPAVVHVQAPCRSFIQRYRVALSPETSAPPAFLVLLSPLEKEQREGPWGGCPDQSWPETLWGCWGPWAEAQHPALSIHSSEVPVHSSEEVIAPSCLAWLSP